MTWPTYASSSLPSGAQIGDLPVAATIDGDAVIIDTTEPTEVLHALTGWALERGTNLGGLSVTRPSLEDIYLELIATEDDG